MSGVFTAFAETAGDSAFWSCVGNSFFNIILGCILGVALGCAAAFATTQAEGLNKFFAGLVGLINLIPGALLVLLLILLLKNENVTLLFCMVVAFSGIYASARSALSTKDNGLVEMAKVFRMPADNTFKYIYWPKLKTVIGGAVSQGITACIAWGITAEVVGQTKDSVGGLIHAAYSEGNVAVLFAITIYIVLLTAFIKLLVFLIRKIHI
jgi:NitT/TauT family transport system permease protein